MTDRPSPMTPPSCDLQDFAFMPLDVARLRDSELASNETPESCWAAVLLWAASWHQIPAASIPNDEKWIAKHAGYALRGKIDKAWSAVRDGALRGWVECFDGRLYHPVVAEKAREAWQAKLKQRWGTECARIKKHNDRHVGADVPKPTFEDWLAGGCLTGHPLFVPGDIHPDETGQSGETASKRQGEGQGQGDIDSEAKASAGATAPPVVDKSPEDEDKAKRQLWVDTGTWLMENGLTNGEARAFMNTVAKEYPLLVADAFREAIANKAPVDAKPFVFGIAKRMKAKQSEDAVRKPLTVTSGDAERTQLYLQAQRNVPTHPPSPEIKAALEAAKASAGKVAA